MSEEMKLKPYTNSDLSNIAMQGIKISPLRVLATYANPDNWKQDYNGPNGSCQWVWIGPVICAFELAQWGVESCPEPRQGVDWEQEYSDAFRVAYKGILSDEIIEGSIAWNVDFIKRHVRFTLPAEVRWPELKEAFGQNTFKDGLCHGYNRAVNDCKQALDKILLDNGLQRN